MASLRLSELCKILDEQGMPARWERENVTIKSVSTLENAGDGQIAFLANPKYGKALETTGASAVILSDGVEVPDGLSTIRCADPYAAAAMVIVAVHGHRKHPRWGLSERAFIDPGASIGIDPNIAAGVTVAADVRIGDRCTIYPGVYIAEGVRIGNDCLLFPNVVIYDQCMLGDRVTIHAGSVVGEDGLGYAPSGEEWIKIPQVGRVVIEDDVEIGANCAIDRATLGQTEIASGTKFGNEVVIGHGTKIGSNCMFVGQVGVAGSVTVGRHVTLAGQVGVAGHLTIGDHVRVAGQSGISGDVPPESEVFGSPAFAIDQARRALFAYQKLPDWVRRIKDLEQEVQSLREQLQDNGRP